MTARGKKAMKAQENLIALMAQYTGKSIQDVQEMAGDIRQEPNPMSTKSHQLDAVLMFIDKPPRYTAKVCLECGDSFGTNYNSVGYCSDTCRIKSFEDHFGVPWNPNGKTQAELWGGSPPTIISPTLWKNLELLLDQIKIGVQSGQTQVRQEDEIDIEDSPPEDFPLFDAVEEHTSPSIQTTPPVQISSEYSFSEDLEVPSFDL